jgi:hypothetical protein
VPMLPIKICRLFPLRAFQNLSCHHCTQHTELIAAFWMGEGCSTCMIDMLDPHFGLVTNAVEVSIQIWTCHGPTQQLQFPLQPDWRMPPLTQLCRPIFVFFMKVMGSAEAQAWSKRSLSWCIPKPHPYLAVLISYIL